MVLAVDPGRAKCGLAVVLESGRCLHRDVVDAERLAAEVGALLRRHPDVERVLVGSGTGSKDARTALAAYFPDRTLETVDEHRTSERARARYLAEHRPAGWRRLLPSPLRVPETAYDDYVAVILAEDYFARRAALTPSPSPGAAGEGGKMG